MRYLGSKTSLLEEIYKIIHGICPAGIFCDPFGGIGTVGSFFKSKGYQVISGDILKFAHCFQVSRVVLNEIPQFARLREYYNIDDVQSYIDKLEPQEGWIVEEYAKNRMYFTYDNAKKLQGCLNFIWKAKDDGLLSECEYSFLIASFINSMDIVANTAGTYYAHLKSLTRKALKEFCFSFVNITGGSPSCRSHLCTANELVRNNDCDILYLDPPYNGRNYQRYYHLPESIAAQRVPRPRSNKSGVYVDDPIISDYNSQARAREGFLDIIYTGSYKCLIFHYTDDGLIPAEFIRSALAGIGNLEEFYFDCRAYATTGESKSAKHHLYAVVRG